MRLDGTVGDSYDNAMAESADGAYETELVWRRKPFADLPVGLVVELEASPPVAGLQGTGTDRNRVLCRPSGTSRLIMKAEQNQFISVRIRQQYIRDRVRLVRRKTVLLYG